MAVRVTATDVKVIIETELTDAVIGAYIISANTFINAVLGTGTTDLLKEIERWMTAHMIASSRERTVSKEEAGGAKVEYSGVWGAALSSTPYGQMVLTLDTTGLLAATTTQKFAKTTAIKSFDE